MRVGLGTGTTVAYLLASIARRRVTARFVATSPAPSRRGTRDHVEPFDVLDQLDLAIDGADQVAPDGWLMKGRGSAHLREKVVAASASRFVVIADASKPSRDYTRRYRWSSSPSACAPPCANSVTLRCAMPRQPRRRRHRRLSRRPRGPQRPRARLVVGPWRQRARPLRAHVRE